MGRWKGEERSRKGKGDERGGKGICTLPSRCTDSRYWPDSRHVKMAYPETPTRWLLIHAPASASACEEYAKEGIIRSRWTNWTQLPSSGTATAFPLKFDRICMHRGAIKLMMRRWQRRGLCVQRREHVALHRAQVSQLLQPARARFRSAAQSAHSPPSLHSVAMFFAAACVPRLPREPHCIGRNVKHYSLNRRWLDWDAIVSESVSLRRPSPLTCNSARVLLWRERSSIFGKMPGRKGLLAPQNTFLDTIATRFDGTRELACVFLVDGWFVGVLS